MQLQFSNSNFQLCFLALANILLVLKALLEFGKAVLELNLLTTSSLLLRCKALLEQTDSGLELIALGLGLLDLLAPFVAGSAVLLERGLHRFVLGLHALASLIGVFLSSLGGLGAMAKLLALLLESMQSRVVVLARLA